MSEIHICRRSFLRASVGTLVATTTTSAMPLPLQAQSSDASTLRIACAGSNVDSLDPHRHTAQVIDMMRHCNLYDGLAENLPDGSWQLVLAESISPNRDATEWTVKLHENIKLHDGRIFTTDDLVYSVERLLDPDQPTKGASEISFIDPANIEVVDDTTAVFRLEEPYGPFRELWSSKYLRLVPRGFDPERPVGTGPFKHESFTAGRESIFVKFDEYFREPAKVDRVIITDIVEPTAQLNALRGGQIHMAYDIPLGEARAIEADQNLNLINNPSSTCVFMSMRTDVEPFNDVRVRKALRLIADRQQMVDIALAGFGTIGNDMNGRSIAPCVETGIAQRKQNIEAAKKLLNEAGQSKLEITLNTVAGTIGMVECALVFAEQAKVAGVNVKVEKHDLSSFLANYQQWHFSVDFLEDRYLTVISRSLIPGGGFNTSHWDDAEFQSLYKMAVTTSDETERCDIVNQMRTIEHERGPHIIWSFSNLLQAAAPSVQGIQPYVNDSPFFNLRKLHFA